MADVKVLFGQRLKIIRERKQISQERLAALAGLNRTYISKIERGERNITLTTMMRLAHALGCNITDLFSNLKDVDSSLPT
ncbi:MAG: helix-turn-helix transcriptional regulator [Candidatus Methanomethylicaceae archaeon]